MQPSIVQRVGLVVLAGVTLAFPACAAITLDWVTVDHAGNPANSDGRGAVGYDYRIGRYEVTNAQYKAFLNAVDPDGTNPNGIYNASMGSDARGGISFDSGRPAGAKYAVKANMSGKPVNYVSWYDAARFANWLHHGQGGGGTETGAYTLSGNTGIIVRNVGATVWIPTEDEWCKAAYYDPTPGAGGGDNYWSYPTQSDSIPTAATADSLGAISNPGANVANYNNSVVWNNLRGNVTTVGSALAANYFGTADQGGNVWEWTDAVINSSRGLSGGGYSSAEVGLSSRYRGSAAPAGESASIGFRVASVPEPATLILTAGFGGLLLIRRRN